MIRRALMLTLLMTCTASLGIGQNLVSKGASRLGISDGKAEGLSNVLAEGFGQAVAIDGKTAFVGEPQGSLVDGLVVVFVRPDTSGTWMAVDTLYANPAIPGIRFGETLAVDGDWLFVGAPADNGQEGAVYVFEQQSFGVWTPHQKLVASVPQAVSAFASRGLAVSGDYAIVGAYLDETAYIFARNSGTNIWSEDAKLVGDSPGAIRRFGWSVDIDGERAIVGGIRESTFEGAAYIFERDGGGAWNQEEYLTLSDGVTYDYFGSDVALQGDIALVASLGYGARPPFITSFKRDGLGVWTEKDRLGGVLTQSTGGEQMQADLNAVVTGINYADSLYVVAFDSTFTVEDGFKSSTASGGEGVGYSVGISGDYLVAGAPGNLTGAGHVYFFERNVDSTWTQVAAFAGQGETFPSITGGTVPCTSGFASIFPCDGIDLASFVSLDDLGFTAHTSDVWGWHHAATGREFAIVTQTSGTSFVEVTDPENPVLAGTLPIHAGSNENSWHDVRVYKDHAFIVADAAGDAGVQIFDLTQLVAAPPGPPITGGAVQPIPVFTETAHYGGFASSHNISINEETGFAYVTGAGGGGTTCGGGLHMLDISTPTTPSFVGCFADETTGRSLTGYSHDAQCVVYHGPDVVHQGKEVCFSSNETHVVISDVSTKNSPSTIGKATYPEARYIHQGWVTEDHRFFLLDDELDETGGTATTTTTYVWDIQDLDDPILVNEFENPINVIDHNQFVLGRYSLQANYMGGVRIIDFYDVQNPTEVMYFDTYPGANAPVFEGAWGVYPYLPSGIILATSIEEGFFVLRPTVPLRLALDLKVFLEGPFAGDDSMSTGGVFQGALPASHPYTEPDYNATVLDFDIPAAALTLPGNAVDWVVVELRDTETDSVTSEAGILLRNGRVVAPDGDTLRFDGALPGSYWVVVRHRNHLSVMSSAAVDLSSGAGAWDFTDAANKAYGTAGMKSLTGGKFGMYASDGSIDGQITAPDFNGWNAATTAGVTGYSLSDFNLDGLVTAPDFNLWNANTTAGASSQVPD